MKKMSLVMIHGGLLDRRARKEVIKGVAHMVSMERPEEFNRVVLDFLSGL